MKNRIIIFAAAGLRATAIGMSGVLLGIYLARLDFSASIIGFIVAAGLAGGTVAALGVTLAADRFGRRRSLFLLALMAAAGGIAVAAASDAAIIALVAFGGMMNGMGKDRGASSVIEQAILPSTASEEERTTAFAFYGVIQTTGAALGSLLAGLPVPLHRFGGLSEPAAMKLTLVVYSVLMLASGLLYPRLSSETELKTPTRQNFISAESRGVLWQLSMLFALDSFAGGFLTDALLTYFFAARFGLGAAGAGLLFAFTGGANALSQFGAAYLARRIGLVNTMVFTHIPSSLLLLGVAFAPSLPLAIALFLLHQSLVQMDVPTRQSYVMAVMRPEERTFASGVTGLVRLGGWAAGPSVAGMLMQEVSLAAPLIAAPVLKIIYDLMLFYQFRYLKPPEERHKRHEGATRGSAMR